MKNKLYLVVVASLILKGLLAVLVSLILFIGGYLLCLQYQGWWHCREFLMEMKKEGPANIRLEYVNLNHKTQKFECRYEIKETYGYTKGNMQEFLQVKALAEKLLGEGGEIPAEYRIRVRIRAGSPAERILFSNENFNEELGDLESGGYQLFNVNIAVPCYLSELSYLTGVKSLKLRREVIIDNVSGLQNMGELQYVHQWSQNNNSMSNSFTDEDIQKIKEMYPGCIVEAVSSEF